MIEDKITLALKDIAKLKEELKGIKKDLKHEEKLDTPEYIDIKRAYDDIRKQKKESEEAWQQELAGTDFYQKLREMKVQKEEDIATANQKLFDQISSLPQKPFLMNVELEEGPLRVQIMPEMRLYLNGKEEKKRAA